MSQIQRFGISGVSPAGPILTLSGDIGGPVGPDGAGDIEILGKDTPTVFGLVEVDGSPGISTLSITPLLDTLVTNDATPTTFPLAVFALSPDNAVVFSAYVIGSKDDNSAACGGFVTCAARRDAINPTVLVGQNPLLSRDSMTGLPIFGILLDGNSIKVGVQGVAAETWNWTCSYQYVAQ